MSGKAEVKPDALPDLDDLLQCPVCYEIPSGQIFQCNEGHHVCGRCKARLDVCPVCRAMFFGTRNYAMEELIANVRKLRAFKLGGKVTTGSAALEVLAPTAETSAVNPSTDAAESDENDLQLPDRTQLRPPPACKGLFRCLCCKIGKSERLPLARLLNHLRYFHSPELIEGKSENGEYLQAWQFSTVPGRIVTAVRVSDMGIFFLIIEINNDSVCAWLSMASAPWVAHDFCYTVTISGNDREAIFSDCVWSVRSCEGSLKKRGHSLIVTGLDARALVAPASISGKLSIRRAPPDHLTNPTQPRAVLRVANRGNQRDISRAAPAPHELEPSLQDLQNDVARLSRAFATLGREANALMRSDAEMRARIEDIRYRQNTGPNDHNGGSEDGGSPPADLIAEIENERPPLSRNARRRMRQRLRAVFEEPVVELGAVHNGPVRVERVGYAVVAPPALAAPAAPSPPAPTPPAPAAPPSGPSNGVPQAGNTARANKKKRRQRR